MTDPNTTCAVAWPVCPDCLGTGLSTTATRSTCPQCRRTWSEDDVIPCPWPADTILADTHHTTGLVCASHAAHPSAADLTHIHPVQH